MIEAYYGVLTALFSPILSLPPIIGELIVAAIVTFIITLFYRYLVDQNKTKQLREQVAELQKNIKEVQKDDPKKASEMTSEMLKLTNQQMKMSFKPMIPTLLFVILLFPWIATVFTGPIVMLPFEIFGRTSLGWFLWYVIISVPLSFLFRKLMGVI